MAIFQKSDLALVTGAGSGMGRETCKLLALQGATVVATDINKLAADETVKNLQGKNHLSLKLDVVKKGEIEAVLAEIIKKYSSPPNILVNCAGLMLFQLLQDITEDTYYKIFDVNVKGTVLVTQAVCRELIGAKKSGSIINMSSLATAGLKGQTVYGASKGAVEAFSRSAAKEFGPAGIRVNSISPGYIDTPMMESFGEVPKEMYCKTNPLRRPGKPQEVAEMIVFLASAKSSYTNGAPIKIDGGHS